MRSHSTCVCVCVVVFVFFSSLLFYYSILFNCVRHDPVGIRCKRAPANIFFSSFSFCKQKYRIYRWPRAASIGRVPFFCVHSFTYSLYSHVRNFHEWMKSLFFIHSKCWTEPNVMERMKIKTVFGRLINHNHANSVEEKPKADESGASTCVARSSPRSMLSDTSRFVLRSFAACNGVRWDVDLMPYENNFRLAKWRKLLLHIVQSFEWSPATAIVSDDTEKLKWKIDSTVCLGVRARADTKRNLEFSRGDIIIFPKDESI